MAGFKQPDFIERQQAAAKARQAALEKFRAKVGDPALAQRLTERSAGAADRKALKSVRDAEKAEKKARDAERAEQAKRDAALQAERDKVEREERARAVEAENKAARDARYAARKSRKKRK
jgi:Family of unknown function (DUF6481)